MDAQGSRLSGNVYHVTPEDSLGLSGRAVVLHVVRGSSGAAIDSARTGRDGRYQFVVSSPDTTALYYVSVEHHDIGYFSNAQQLGPGLATTAPSIIVYDTSGVRPPIVLHERHIIVRSEDVDGTRQIIELITLLNNGRFTRIAADTTSPVWQGVLPAGAFQLAVGESEVGAGAVYTRGVRLAVAAPIPPGDKQLLFSYIVPRSEDLLDLPVDQPTVRFTISLEDTTAVAFGDGLVLYGTEEVGGAVFKRYDAGGLSAGAQVSVRFKRALLSVARLKLAVIVSATLALGWTLTWWIRKQTHKAAP